MYNFHRLTHNYFIKSSKVINSTILPLYFEDKIIIIENYTQYSIIMNFTAISYLTIPEYGYFEKMILCKFNKNKIKDRIQTKFYIFHISFLTHKHILDLSIIFRTFAAVKKQQ
jgi:hypothetical protein